MSKVETQIKRYTIKPLRRIGAFIADFVIFLMATVSLYAVAITPLTKTITRYKTYAENQEAAFNTCKTILVDSHLIQYDEEGNEVKIEEYFKNNIHYRLEEKYVEDGYYTDIFLHFYVYYCGNVANFTSAHKSYSVSYVNENVYKINSPDNILFALTNDDVNLPLKFSEEAKKQIGNYLNGEVNGESQKYFDTYISLMTSSWETATNIIIDSDEYTAAVEQYTKNNDRIFAIYSYSSMIFYTLMFFLFYLLLPFLLKKGQSPAKKILHIGLFDNDNKPVSFKKLLFKSFMLYFLLFFTVMLLPVMDLGISIIYLPLFTIGNFTFNLLLPCIALLLLIIGLGVFMCIDKNHQSPLDKILDLYALKDNVNLDEEIDNRPSNVIEQENFDRGSSV